MLTPEKWYEERGFVPNVCFPCATIHDSESGKIALYYGCADSYVGLAFTHVDDIVDYIKKMSGRIDCIHLKDYQIIRKRVSPTETGPVSPDYAPVGKGTLKWGEIIPAALASGTKNFIVEEDSAAQYADTLAEVEYSIKYLTAHF